MPFSKPKLERYFKRGWDADGFFTLILSLIAGILTLGFSHLWLLGRVMNAASTATAQPPQPEAMAVLGKQLGEQGELSQDYRQRLDRVVALCAEWGAADVLVIGGGVSEKNTEAAAGADYLLQAGIDGKTIEKEELSLNTLENFRHARPWFSRHPQSLVISNRYHLLRVLTMARGLGLDIRPCAAEDQCRLWDKFPRLMLEAFFLHWYWSGRLFAELTNNQRMLEKIK